LLNKERGERIEAFPEAITEEILLNQVSHKKPYTRQDTLENTSYLVKRVTNPPWLV